MVEGLRLALNHAAGRFEGQARISAGLLALWTIGGGAFLLATIALFLALEP